MIGFLSDFGGDNGYVASMKAVASNICSDKFVDIAHNIPRHDLKRGSFILSNVYKYFPKGTVFVCVIDPGVGTDREAIAVESGDYYFVGPNNGLLSRAVEDSGNPRYYLVENQELCLGSESYTFDGRDLFAPVGAYLADGLAIEEVGSRMREIESLDFGEWGISDGEIFGEVVFIDSFGNLVTNIPFCKLDQLNFGQKVLVNNSEVSFLESYGKVGEEELLLTVGGHGYLEVAANKDSAKELTKLGREDEVLIKLDGEN